MDKKLDKKIIALVAIVVVAAVAALLLVSSPSGQKACTEEAKLCPGGTAVGRTGPNCEFAPCPENGSSSCKCPSGYRKDGDACNPECYYSTPPCLAPSVACTPILGGDRDAHGCIGSAGYSWCEAKQKCLRIWEEPCESNGSSDTNSGGSLGGGTGMANPASVYCEDQGGTLEIVDTPEGQVGMCHFANGQVCEEWALFRSNATNCTGLDGTPAKTYCKPEQRQVGNEPKACTMEYRPVCGWTAAGVKTQTYGNPCVACIETNVSYWTEGEC